MKAINTTILILVFALCLSGCGGTRYYKKASKAFEKDVIIEMPASELRVGEKFTYQLTWMGMPVGLATLHAKELTEINGHQAYHIIAKAKSNAFLSAIFRVDDEIHSYIDKEKLFSHRIVKRIKEGRYRANEMMDFDQVKHIATYKSLRNGSVKTMEIPENVQDELSCLYLFRSKNAEIGKPVFIDVNADEKNWRVEVKVLGKGTAKIPGLGSFKVFKTEPQARFRLDNTPLKKGNMWIWFSSDKRRIPLIVKVKAPIASVMAVIKKIE